jgi:hypothetical protein
MHRGAGGDFRLVLDRAGQAGGIGGGQHGAAGGLDQHWNCVGGNVGIHHQGGAGLSGGFQRIIEM